MFCDFMLLDVKLMQLKPSLLGAVAIYATNKITNKSKAWNASLSKCSGGLKEEALKPIANQLFFFIKKLEQTALKTMFRKYQQKQYSEVVRYLRKIEMPPENESNRPE
jgi:hypothetical protein